ncbi:hypothetical protein [Cellulomonas sp. Marseille-Q8402]
MSGSHRGVLHRIARRRDDDGAALVVVVGSMLVLAMLAMTALAYTMSGQRFARYDQDYSAAMAAAQAGVDDFISRLNRDPGYGDLVDCSNESWKGPVTDANTCGWNASTEAGWLPVSPADESHDAAWFHVAVQNMAANKNKDAVDLLVTGRVQDVTRTVQATVGKGGSTDYVYYTDRESADPANTQAYTAGVPHDYCGKTSYEGSRLWWDGRSTIYNNVGTRCQEIQFGDQDVLYGSVFSNDAILSVGGEFQGAFETAYPQCQNVTATVASWTSQCLRAGSSSTTFQSRPTYSEPRFLADTSAEFANHPGCHYYGSTRVVLSADGYMTVWNKKSVNGNTAPVAIGELGELPPTCGSLDALDSAAGARVPVPDDMVIYVATAPDTVTKRQCYKDELGGPEGRTLPLGSYAASHASAPAAGASYTVDTNMTDETRYCGEGNLYIEGVLHGAVTAASAQSIIVTGDLVMKEGVGNSSGDMLGLVATNAVEVFHPRVGTVDAVKKTPSCSWNCAYKWAEVSGIGETSGWPTRYIDPVEGKIWPTSGVQIAASIQTLQHSFYVQKYSEGPQKGELMVRGSIAQRWRGIVARQGTSGYTKLYVYDDRLQSRWPPYFPKWVNAQFTLRVSGEVDTPDAIRASVP